MNACASGSITELVEGKDLLEAASALADRIGKQDPLAVRITKTVFHAPREAHPVIDTLAQGMLFESQAKFDRMAGLLGSEEQIMETLPNSLPAKVGVLGGGRMGAGIAHAFLVKGCDVRGRRARRGFGTGRPRTRRIRRREIDRARCRRWKPR